jgi:hypothetical protein
MYRIGDSYKAALELGKIRSTREIAATSHQEKKNRRDRARRGTTNSATLPPPAAVHARTLAGTRSSTLINHKSTHNVSEDFPASPALHAPGGRVAWHADGGGAKLTPTE